MLNIQNEAVAQAAAQVTATAFWERFQQVQVSLNTLVKFTGKSQFVGLACDVKNSIQSELFAEKVCSLTSSPS